MRRLVLGLFMVVSVVGCTSTNVANKSLPTPDASTAVSSPSPSSGPLIAPSLSLATVQRLNATTGFIAAWTGGGPALARTIDSGATWQRIDVPAAHLTALRFIDANVGWAAGFIPRDMPGVACQQAPPTATSPCYGVVLRTQDGGATWRKSFLIPYYGTYSEPVQQIQAIDGQTAWALVLDCGPASPPQDPFGCPAEVRGTTDGGLTWRTLTAGNIVAMRFATALRGWLAVVNADGSSDIKFTNDGGSTWAAAHLHISGGTVVGLDAANSLTAWVLTRDGAYCTATTCSKYELFRTTDGGTSWSSLANPKTSAAGNCVGGQLAGPLFASPTRGWLAENTGAGGVQATTGLLSSDDGGTTWRCWKQPANTNMVSAADTSHLWVTVNSPEGASSLFSSDDGGLTWRGVSLAGLV